MNTGSENQERSLREEIDEASKEVFERARDEAGRFAKTADPEPVEDPAPTVDASSVPAPVADEDPFPQSWKQDYKTHWGSVPKELKDYIRQHEADTRKAMTAQDEDRLLGKNYRGVHQAMQPYMAMIQAEGGTAESAINALLNQAYVLRHGSPEQKRQMVLSAIKTYGIDITEPSGAQGWVDPQVQALQQELAELKDWRQSSQQWAQQQEQASINSQIQSFGADPKHPHFANSQVQSLMGQFLMNGADSMEKAYEQAIWAVPELRSTLLAEQHAQEEAKRAAEAKAKADAARKASGSVRGSSGGMASAISAPKGTLREEIAAQLAAAKNRI